MAKRAASPRHTQKLNIDFFQVGSSGGGKTAFRNALIEAARVPGRHRACLVWGEMVGLFEIRRDQHLFEGEVARIRMTDTPSIGSHDCVLNEIELTEDQGIAERSAFLFDSTSGVLAIHARREAVSASRLGGYCDVYVRNTEDRFEVNPLLRQDAEQKLRSMNIIKKINVQYTRNADGGFANPDQATQSFARTVRTLGASTMDVAISSGKGNEPRLSFDSAAALVSTALRGRGEAVEKLVVTGRNAADERLVLDLLESRLRATKPVEFRDRSASYEQRRRAIREAYEEFLPILP